jgi:hypothetical protein
MKMIQSRKKARIQATFAKSSKNEGARYYRLAL